MTTDPITISQDARISEAARVMLYNKISGLPVVDSQGKLVGIITESDIFRIVTYEWGRADSTEPTSALKTPFVPVSQQP